MEDQNQPAPKQMILASEFASKARSKREVYVFLSSAPVSAFLPEY